MKKGMKKIELVAECNNKVEMVNRAIGFIEMQEGESNIIASKWAGYWDGLQWSSRIIFINPEIAKKYNPSIKSEFGVKFDI